MLRDPFVDESLLAYIKITERYANLVDELTNSVSRNHDKFVAACDRLKELRAEVEQARLEMLKRKAAFAARESVPEDLKRSG